MQLHSNLVFFFKDYKEESKSEEITKFLVGPLTWSTSANVKYGTIPRFGGSIGKINDENLDQAEIASKKRL